MTKMDGAEQGLPVRLWHGQMTHGEPRTKIAVTAESKTRVERETADVVERTGMEGSGGETEGMCDPER